MRKLRVVSCGVGAVGALIAKFLLEKEGVELVGAVDVDKTKVGKDLGNLVGMRKTGIKVTDDLDSTFSHLDADIAVHATSSKLEDTCPQIATMVEHGVNVISTCEELSYPYASEPELSNQLDVLARKHDVTVLGTGINPGFLMDTLVITLTAACERIDSIKAVRRINAATRRLPFQKKIGAGLTVEEFKQRIRKRQITGHVGLEQSIGMIADAIGWKLDLVLLEPAEPVISKKNVASKDIRVGPGQVAGLRQKAKGILKNREVMVLDFQACIGVKDEHDSITISGVPTIRQTIRPCVHGDIGTVAMIVNSIPKVINAPAGLITMKDLPVPSAATEDMRKYLRQLN